MQAEDVIQLLYDNPGMSLGRASVITGWHVHELELLLD